MWRHHHVLVEKEHEERARELGGVALGKLHANAGRRLGKDMPVDILVVRPATTDDVEFCRWGEEMLAQERAGKPRLTFPLLDKVANVAPSWASVTVGGPVRRRRRQKRRSGRTAAAS
jgi:hypothetical protein